jgi:hypothetical protein
MDVQGVSLFTARSIDVQVSTASTLQKKVFDFPVPSRDVTY